MLAWIKAIFWVTTDLCLCYVSIGFASGSLKSCFVPCHPHMCIVTPLCVMLRGLVGLCMFREADQRYSALRISSAEGQTNKSR